MVCVEHTLQTVGGVYCSQALARLPGHMTGHQGHPKGKMCIKLTNNGTYSHIYGHKFLINLVKGGECPLQDSLVHGIGDSLIEGS